MTQILNLKYSGREITQNGGMDVTEVTDTLDGFSDFVRSITSGFQDEERNSSLVVQGFRRGSFDIQLALEFAATAQTALSAIGADNLLDTLKQAFNLLKHLKGEPPKSIKRADHGSIFVENNSGKIIIFNQPVVHAVLNTNASQAAEKFIKQPLREAAEKLEIRVNRKVAAKIDRSSSESFTAIGAGDPLGEFKSKQYLTIQTVVLEGDGLWRFSDGRNKFRAQIDDEKFLRRVRQGAERFGRGDILEVRLISKQEKIRGQLRTTHIIEEVLGHEPYKARQATLF